MSKIVITGFMGSGKSTVANALAQLLAYDVVDLDKAIELEQGRSPGEIIEMDGESRFREIEQRVLISALQDPTNVVIALGGGAWMLEANRERIAQHAAISVWLDAPFALCWKRILTSGEPRPLARSKESALQLFNQRRSSYELADFHVTVAENMTAADVAQQISNALSRMEKPS